MIDIYFTDRCKIVSISTDIDGVKTKSIGSEIPCRIEDMNQSVMNDKGQEVVANSLILIGKDENVKYGDKIIITKKNNIAFEQDTKEFIIKKKGKQGMFDMQYNEVYV